MVSPYITNSVIESAVALILIRAGEISNAMTVSFFSEVAHHPTSLWVSVAKNSFTFSLLQQQPEFTLAVLNQNQKDIALQCGTVSGRDQDKVSQLDLYISRGKFLFLRNALACTACRVRTSIDIDDHTLFIAEIIGAELDSRTSNLRQLLLSDIQK